ncbi:Ribosome association toxin PasT (RatA) of the RatAB toxin-antitoxin module [Allopseudospirillum japonicum]|uniref:Ribosome association toxin PasT (RatA) of the RatAB toxin-antitoxin module n=1 Tax=Allopseudospirillum japonicum TaxID=64971 RepID=A0A1H6R7I5_9GAMM|nr:type II toxin-antitoxin system RatA family toxin [Allopseudospirillum japonicum]SEI47730.1 Ribosome association toxin PasT (RatA) of the RatAB toxin-antitoxin module [Allopseudospirillum japonicum]
MSSVERSALVMHSAQQMFDLVNDCESYPKFLPWCSYARLVEHGEDYLVGELEISKGGVRQRFTTRNQLKAPEHIELSLVDGPFKYLRGQWHFTPLGEQACKVSLSMEFELSGRLLNLALGSVFNQIANTLVDAFCKRADQVYGR